MGELRIIPRSEWGALPPKEAIKKQEYDIPLPQILEWVVVHKTNLPRNFSVQDLQVRSQTLSVKKNKIWDDIPYHYYITWNGDIHEAREMKYAGGHAGKSKEAMERHERGDDDFIKWDPDYGTVGIALSGMFYDDVKRDLASEAQIESLRWLLGHLREKYPQLTREKILRHRQVDEVVTRGRGNTPDRKGYTDCPGKGITKQLEKIQ